MGNPIENALLKYKNTYAWDKNLISDTYQELHETLEAEPDTLVITGDTYIRLTQGKPNDSNS